ncbi:MAG: VOC family protein [Chloroflexota bacterium]
MKIDRLDHLVLIVTDIEATCAFYQHVLGIEVVALAHRRLGGLTRKSLNRAGFIEKSRGDIQVTQTGLDYLDYITSLAPQTTEEILAMWREALRAGERKMLDALVAVYPNSLSRVESLNRVDENQ